MGDKEYEQFNYLKAVEYYEHALKKDSSDVHVLRRLAQGYNKIGDNSNSFKFFDLLTNNTDHVDSDWVLYGDLSRENGKYSLAKKCYLEYLKSQPEASEIKSLVKQMEVLEKFNLGQLKCNVETVPFNSIYSDFAPAFYNNHVIFSSGRKSKRFRNDKYGWNGQYFLELFQYNNENVEEEQVMRFAAGIGSKYHEAVVCFSSDFTQMYFTRSNYYNGKLKRDDAGVNNLKIFVAEEKDGSWDITEEFPFNSDEYSVGHPSLSKDGNILYFVSDMPGGNGGTDVYKSVLKNGEWTKPENLGKEINTSGNEMFPHVKGSTLFFASNGHAGMGGLDIYVTNLSDEKLVITHIGAPVNSEEDDFSLVMHSKENQGYFSSNRKGGQGDDDIYKFEIDGTNDVEIQIRNADTKELILADEILINGALDSELVLDASSQVYSKAIEREQSYNLHILKEGFESLDTNFYSNVFDSKKKYTYFLKPIPVVEEIVEEIPTSIPPIYFNFDKYDITSEANSILVDVYELLQKHDALTVKIIGNTDVRGSKTYNKKLAENRVTSAREILIKMGISPDRLEIGINGEEKPLDKKVDQSQEEWHKFNRRVDFELKTIEK